jgi:2-methylcitrate dehydratase PrpD
VLTDEAVRNPEVDALRQRVTVAPDTALALALALALGDATPVRLKLTSGAEYTEARNPGPATDDGLDNQWAFLVHKFKGLVVPVIVEDRAAAIIEGLENLENRASITEVISSAPVGAAL